MKKKHFPLCNAVLTIKAQNRFIFRLHAIPKGFSTVQELKIELNIELNQLKYRPDKLLQTCPAKSMATWNDLVRISHDIKAHNAF